MAGFYFSFFRNILELLDKYLKFSPYNKEKEVLDRKETAYA